MVKQVEFQGDMTDFEAKRTSDISHLLLHSRFENKTRSLNDWLNRYNDLVVKGQGFTRTYHVLSKFRCSTTKKFKMEYFYE